MWRCASIFQPSVLDLDLPRVGLNLGFFGRGLNLGLNLGFSWGGLNLGLNLDSVCGEGVEDNNAE